MVRCLRCPRARRLEGKGTFGPVGHGMFLPLLLLVPVDPGKVTPIFRQAAGKLRWRSAGVDILLFGFAAGSRFRFACEEIVENGHDVQGERAGDQDAARGG